MSAKSAFQTPVAGRRIPAPICITLVDDDESIHHSMRQTFKEFAGDWKLNGYQNGQEALKHIPSAPPHAVLMDVSMPGISGIDCTRKLKTLLPNLPIIMFTARTDTAGVMDSMMAGACGYLIKPMPPTEIVQALKKALAGLPAFCPVAGKKMLHGLHGLGKNSAASGLTRREREIMTSVCRRQSDKEIAETFGISTATVHRHLANTFKKLNVHDRDEAVRKFISL